jgi:putative transposase
MHHRLYIHLIWTTRGRERLIDRDLAGFLCRFLRSMARKERAYILEIGMVQTHVHLLARVHPTKSISSLVKRLKGASSTVAAQEGRGKLGRLLWAKGYSVQSVSERSLDIVRVYLRSQPVHHASEAIVDWPGDVPEYDKADGGEGATMGFATEVAARHGVALPRDQAELLRIDQYSLPPFETSECPVAQPRCAEQRL